MKPRSVVNVRGTMEESRKSRPTGRSSQGSLVGFPEWGRSGLGGPAPAAGRSVGELLELLGGSVRRESADLAGLAHLSAAELESEHGFSQRGAQRLEAAFELGRRASRPRSERAGVTSPRAVFELLEPELAGLDQEAFVVLLLDGKHRLRRHQLISLGTLTTSLVHPREVFRTAIESAAAAIVVAHNHPSGDPEPSAEDLAVTRRLIRSGRLLGVPLLDHVVLGDRRWVSLRERISFDDDGSEAGR